MPQIAPSFSLQDRDFVALVDGAFADAASRSGHHLLCRVGCSQCCIGVFAIGPADVLRLQQALGSLRQSDPARAAQLQERARADWARLALHFPGDVASGRLTVDADGEPGEAFQGFANDEPCTLLNPDTGSCELYEARPHTCRAYGPPVATAEGYGVCELCFQTASPEEVAAAAIAPDPPGLVETLDDVAIAAGAVPGRTIVAYALLSATGV